MRISSLFLAVFLLAAPASAAELSKQDEAVLHTEITTMMQRLRDGDIAAVVDTMPPGAVARLGGRDRALSTLSTMREQRNARNVTVEKFTIGKALSPIQVGNTTICFIPTETILRTGNRRLRATSFVVASREKGKDRWQLMRGGGIARRPAALQEIFPGFPTVVNLPRVRIRRID